LNNYVLVLVTVLATNLLLKENVYAVLNFLIKSLNLGTIVHEIILSTYFGRIKI